MNDPYSAYTLWRVCTRKMKYRNADKAWEAVQYRHSVGEKGLEAYFCKHCGWWHMGHRKHA